MEYLVACKLCIFQVESLEVLCLAMSRTFLGAVNCLTNGL